MTGNQPIAFTEEMLPSTKVSKRDDKPQERPIPDPIGQALGCTFYIADKTFDALRYPMFDRGGKIIPRDKMIFRRFYPEKRVIIELINADTDKIRKEVLQKCEALVAYNKAHTKATIGYVPLLALQKVPTATFAEALEGKVFNLPERNPYLKTGMAQKAVFVTHGGGEDE